MTATQTTPEMILASSPEAASIQTVTGWIARGGQFWGTDERMARYCGSTHRICEENPEHGPVENRSYCEACHAEKKEAQWQAMPKAPFSEALMPLCVFNSDRFFFHVDDLRDWLEEHELNPEGVRLVQCEPVHAYRAALAAAPQAPAAPVTTASPWQSALSIRMAQGWRLGGDRIPVLYTDTINDEQVSRDDLWLCTTSAFSAPAAPAVDASGDGWYLQDTRSYVGNDVLWWAKDGNGYTTDVSKAHVFTREEAFAQAAMRGVDRAWPKAYIDDKTRPAVDMQYINHDAAIAAQAVAKGDQP